MKLIATLLSVILLFSQMGFADDALRIKALKDQIITMAKDFEGQGDADFSKQKALDVLVEELVLLAPQKPVKDRISVIAGVWRQVWGKYDYRNEDRGIDPELGIEEIYQVVNEKGYYYNVSYLYKDGDRNQKRIGLLRGKFKLDKQDSNSLKVKFTDYPGASKKSDNVPLWALAEMAENKTLPNRITIVSSWIVRWFFGGGTLREAYTDKDLRIVYGASGGVKENETIYVMTRVQ
jgi:hypothetical protein